MIGKVEGYMLKLKLTAPIKELIKAVEKIEKVLNVSKKSKIYKNVQSNKNHERMYRQHLDVELPDKTPFNSTD